jgi:ketosteroid isomerase-like protein
VASEHPNLAVMRAAVAAFMTGDAAALARLFSPDIVWRVPGRGRLSKVYRGQAETFGFFAQLMQETGGTFKVDSQAMFAGDEGGVLVDRITASRNGKTLDIGLLLHVTIRDGRIVEGVDHFHQEYLWDAFWE